MQILYILIGLLIILSAIWWFIVLVNWAIFPIIVRKELRNIADKIEELGNGTKWL